MTGNGMARVRFHLFVQAGVKFRWPVLSQVSETRS